MAASIDGAGNAIGTPLGEHYQRVCQDVDVFEYECICVDPPGHEQAHSMGCATTNRVRAELYAIETGGPVPLLPTIGDDVPASWRIVASQQPKTGRPGLSYHVDDPGPEYGGRVIHTLTWRNRKGRLVGILYYYPTDFTARGVTIQRAGSVNMWVDPARHGRGIGTRLAVEALRRWPEIDVAAQQYTAGGAAVAERARRTAG